MTRRYCGDTLVLETVFRTASGAASLTDFMARREGGCDIVRLVRGLQGDVAMRMELVARFDYGAVVPWASRQEDGRLRFVAGPDRLLLDTNVKTRGEDFRTVARVHRLGRTGGELRSQLVALLLAAPRGAAGDTTRWSRSRNSGRIGRPRSSLATITPTPPCAPS